MVFMCMYIFCVSSCSHVWVHVHIEGQEGQPWVLLLGLSTLFLGTWSFSSLELTSEPQGLSFPADPVMG